MPVYNILKPQLVHACIHMEVCDHIQISCTTQPTVENHLHILYKIHIIYIMYINTQYEYIYIYVYKIHAHIFISYSDSFDIILSMQGWYAKYKCSNLRSSFQPFEARLPGQLQQPGKSFKLWAGFMQPALKVPV